jgi:hypothetical protein
MQLEFIKNIQFTELIKCAGRLREFNFRKVQSFPEGLFTIDVCDDRGNRLMFKMVKENNHWKLFSEMPLPEWIIEKEAILGEISEEYNK